MQLKEKQQLCQQCPKRRNHYCTVHGDEWKRVIKQLPTCEGWGNVQKPVQAEKLSPVKNMAIVSCHFNPCGYSAPVENCKRFLGEIGHPVTLVELSFNGSFEFENSIKICGDITKNNMWQKERMLNIGIESLPPDVDAVAWLDADIVFTNPNWYEDTLKLLRTCPVVQLFQRVDYLGNNGDVIRRCNSWANNYTCGNQAKSHGQPGFAWAARRDAIPDGIYDKDIIGGGDCHLIASWLEETKWVERQYTSLKRPALDFANWKSKQLPRVQGRIGCVNGAAFHLYHGSRENRQYVDRLQILRNNNFDIDDIRIGDNGLWEWSSDKPGLHADVADYFHARKEDL